jgi:hypothetical protein
MQWRKGAHDCWSELELGLEVRAQGILDAMASRRCGRAGGGAGHGAPTLGAMDLGRINFLCPARLGAWGGRRPWELLPLCKGSHGGGSSQGGTLSTGSRGPAMGERRRGLLPCGRRRQGEKECGG